MQIPVVESDRLILRAFAEQSDFDAYAEFYASEQTKYYGGPMDRESAWRAIASMMGHWVIRGYGAWAVEEKSTGDFCGVVGLWYPEAWPEREITWAVIQRKQGLGIAFEAAVRAKLYAYETLGWDSVFSCISAENHASIALAEKLGATVEREVTSQKRGRVLVYRHSR